MRRHVPAHPHGPPLAGLLDVPLPERRGPLWVNFRSPLLWDVFAISTYFTVSLVFWYVGLIPDLATVRDRASRARKADLRRASRLGWTGSARTGSATRRVYLLLAGLATPLVLSVHSIVSMDFADVGDPRLAHHDFPALLRRRRHLLAASPWC